MPDIEKVDTSKLAQGLPSSKFLASQIMEEMGYNPIRDLVEIRQKLERMPEDCQDHALMVGIAKELAKYYAPTMRAIDVNVTQNSQMVVNITRFDYGNGLQVAGAAVPAAVSRQVVDAVVSDESNEEEEVDDDA